MKMKLLPDKSYSQASVSATVHIPQFLKLIEEEETLSVLALFTENTGKDFSDQEQEMPNKTIVLQFSVQYM